MSHADGNKKRRSILTGALAAAGALGFPRFVCAARHSGVGAKPEKRWYDAAVAMRQLAESWGDQSYGAVLVLNGAIVGYGPSRVVQRGDYSAHAEREAIRDAQRRLGTNDLAGSVLYSTSRPCVLCETAAADANVARMIHGLELKDAGRPRR